MSDKDLAASDLAATMTPFHLFAGDADVITEEGIVDTGNLAKYTVVGKITATGKLVAHDPAAVDGSQVAYGVLTQAANATAADVRVGVYTSGFFNHAALVWNAAVDTLVKRQIAFQGTDIRLGTVRL